MRRQDREEMIKGSQREQTGKPERPETEKMRGQMREEPRKPTGSDRKGRLPLPD